MELEATVKSLALSDSNEDPSRPMVLTITIDHGGDDLCVPITRSQARGLYPGMDIRIKVIKVWGRGKV